jgi:hypothetical protein
MKAAVAMFIKDLRHYMTHRALPIMQMSYTGKQNPQDRRVDLDLKKASLWENWSPL